MQSGESGQPEQRLRTDHAVEGTPIPRPIVASLASAPSGEVTSSPSTSGTGGSRSPTLTQRIRSLQPPDVARQALSELSVLAHELSNLPELLEAAGLARSHQASYFEATNAYLALAHQAWEAIGEERLEQTGAEPEYRQRAIGVARRITQLQQEARAASANSAFSLLSKTRLYWHRRTRLIREGLRVWQDSLASPLNATDLGQGLFLLRGFVGLAAAGSLWLGLLDYLIGATLATLSLLGVGLVALLAGAIVSGTISAITTFSVGILATALVWLFVLLLSVNGPLPVGLLLGASIFSSRRTTRNSGTGSRAVARALQVWWAAVGLIAVPSLLGALLLGGLIVRSQMEANAVSVHSLHQALVLAGKVLALGIAAPALVSLTLLLLLELPVLVISGLRAAADMAKSSSLVPAARYYAVRPALAIDTILTCILVIAVWIVATVVGLQHVVLAMFSFPAGGTFIISLRSVALVAALALPCLALLDLPYRSGLNAWKRSWLADLAARRADVESHIRRLSITDPRTGMQDTSEDNLRSMQYDLVLLQFYQSKIEESQKVRPSPVPEPSQYVVLVLIIAIAALILDAGATLLVHIFPLTAG